MEDYQIVDLYWARSEDAIGETSRKYGTMLNRISYSLLSSSEDAEECVNDTYLEAWNRMPEDRPTYLGAYLARIIRCLSVDRFRASHRQKRGGIAGILRDKDDPSTLIPKIYVSEAPQLIAQGIISGGMIPKIECCIEAIRRGVKKVFVIDGRIPHAILIETLTDEGIGTMFVTGDSYNDYQRT